MVLTVLNCVYSISTGAFVTATGTAALGDGLAVSIGAFVRKNISSLISTDIG